MAVSQQLTVLAVVVAIFCITGKQCTFVNYNFDCSPCDPHVIQLTVDEGIGTSVQELQCLLDFPSAKLSREFGSNLSMQYEH